MKLKRSKRKVAVEIEFIGDGKVQKIGEFGFSGGVPAPRPGSSLRFTVEEEHLDQDGIWNPRDGAPTVSGGFQVNVSGTSRGYRALAQYFLALAELDTSQDADFHGNTEKLSLDGRTRFHFILRKSR